MWNKKGDEKAWNRQNFMQFHQWKIRISPLLKLGSLSSHQRWQLAITKVTNATYFVNKWAHENKENQPTYTSGDTGIEIQQREDTPAKRSLAICNMSSPNTSNFTHIQTGSSLVKAERRRDTNLTKLKSFVRRHFNAFHSQWRYLLINPESSISCIL